MIEIKENQELKLNNLLSYRGKILQSELESIGRDMELKINEKGAKRIAYPIMATYGIDGAFVDMEILIPVSNEIESIGEYKFKKELKIVNAVMMSYKGNSVGLQDACNELNKYIETNKLQPITVGYNVTQSVDIHNIENTVSNIYVGINPNIL